MSAIAQAYQLYQAGRHSEAEAVLSSYLDAQKRDPQGHHLLAIVLKTQSRFAEAVSAIDRAVKLSPSDTNILLEKAQILRDAGRGEESAMVAERLLLRSPGQAHACLIAGNYWLTQDFPERALHYFNEGLVANPDHKKLGFGRIFALKDLCRQDTARTEIERLGSPPELYYTLGQLHMENFQPEQAIGMFRRSLNAQQNMSLAARDLWQCAYMSGGRDALNNAIEEILAQYPDQAEFYIQVADVMTELEEAEEAQNVLDRLEARFGKQPAADRARAAAFQQAGNTAQARKYAQSALDQMPDDISSAMYLAKAALAESDSNQALKLADVHLHKDKDQRSFWLAVKATGLRLNQAHLDFASLVDYDKMIGVYDLKAPDGYSSREKFLSKLKEHLISLHEWNEQPLFQSLRKGTQTTRDLRHDEQPVMRAFFAAIDRCVRDYIDKMPDIDDHPFYSRKSNNFRISGAWSVALKPGGFHVNHIHPKGWVSSSFYVDVPDSVVDHPQKAGWIKFGEPPFKAGDLIAEKYICPKPGRLVLFPSYFWHGTVPFTDGRQRITLPFDVMPLD